MAMCLILDASLLNNLNIIGWLFNPLTGVPGLISSVVNEIVKWVVWRQHLSNWLWSKQNNITTTVSPVPISLSDLFHDDYNRKTSCNEQCQLYRVELRCWRLTLCFTLNVPRSPIDNQECHWILALLLMLLLLFPLAVMDCRHYLFCCLTCCCFTWHGCWCLSKNLIQWHCSVSMRSIVLLAS